MESWKTLKTEKDKQAYIVAYWKQKSYNNNADDYVSKHELAATVIFVKIFKIILCSLR